MYLKNKKKKYLEAKAEYMEAKKVSQENYMHLLFENYLLMKNKAIL